MHPLLRSLSLFGLVAAACDTTPPPAPYGPVPTPAQLAWQQMEYNLFVHFGPNTFTDAEWGDGSEPAEIFRPEALDCDQWAATARAAGMRGIILTAKHHDGFCLWPSATSTHTVAQSPWRDGKGDVLRELSDACRKYGLRFGVYLSPWDRNHPAYGTPAYNAVFCRALDEVLTGYGEVFEQWFDGACGEGPNGKRQVYDWQAFHRTVRGHQPEAVIFSDVGPGCRWIGNERGHAGETCWSRLDTAGYAPGNAPPLDTLNCGNAAGEAWIPGEVDVSIRPGWFYHAEEDQQIKSVEELMEIYYASVGRNALLLLNVPPDRRGRICATDSARLMEFRAARERALGQNLAAGAEARASAVRGSSARYSAAKLLDGDYDTYWATDDGTTTAEVILTLPAERTFNQLLLQEYIPLGQRVARFTVEYRAADSDPWLPLCSGTTIGYKRILRFRPATGRQLRLSIDRAFAPPLLNNLALYLAPERIPAPEIVRDKQGTVRIVPAAEGPLYYTLDGTEPDTASLRYTEPFALPGSGEVRAVQIGQAGRSEVAAARFDPAPVLWRVVGRPQESAAAVDGSTLTVARFAAREPLTVDMGEVLAIEGFSYTPAADNREGVATRYHLSLSADGRRWTPAVRNGLFENIANNPVRQEVRFGHRIRARFLRFEPLETTHPEGYAVAEIGVLTPAAPPRR